MADNEPTTGATPAAPGATPGQSQVSPAAAESAPTPAPTAPAEPATGGPDGLGDAGKQAIDRMKAERNAAIDRAKTAEGQLAELREATQTEQEKAIEAARKGAATEADDKWTGIVRRAQVERALTAAGISQSELSLAAAALAFASLELSDEGQVEDLDKAVIAFKESHPALFAAPARPSGSIDGGARGTPSSSEQVRQAEADGDWRTSISLKNRQLAERARKDEVT